MFDLKAVEIELYSAHQARINAELACCDIEELAEEIRQSHHAFLRMVAQQRSIAPQPIWSPTYASPATAPTDALQEADALREEGDATGYLSDRADEFPVAARRFHGSVRSSELVAAHG